MRTGGGAQSESCLHIPRIKVVLETIEIRNYKSVEKISLPLGRVNVLIGENGAGKSNVLEAIALAGAASAGKLDNEFLASRGIRVTQPQLMRSGFSDSSKDMPIEVVFNEGKFDCPPTYIIAHDNSPYSRWECFLENDNVKADASTFMEEMSSLMDGKAKVTLSEDLFDLLRRRLVPGGKCLRDFIIFSPENSSLRKFEAEGQILPLGINGEGLLKFLSVLSQDEDKSAINSVKNGLKFFGWFKDFDIKQDANGFLTHILIEDRYLAKGSFSFDQKSANEGFLFLVFYFALFSSKLTPEFFAVDNIDASLNPKLCEQLMRHLVTLSKEHGKQVILTTHNPALLDGLNLDDDEQRLFVVSRGSRGQTKITRVKKPADMTIRLSEAFLRGSLGGLPKGF